jgi:hypothetical protein
MLALSFSSNRGCILAFWQNFIVKNHCLKNVGFVIWASLFFIMPVVNNHFDVWAKRALIELLRVEVPLRGPS